MPTVLVLTDLTRRAGDDRRVVVQGVDLPLRHVIIGIVGFLIGAPIGLIAVGILRFFDSVYVWAITVAVVEAVCYLAVLYRVRSGVGIFQSERDRRRSGNNRVWLGTQELAQLDRATVELCVRGALPRRRDRPPLEFGV